MEYEADSVEQRRHRVYIDDGRDRSDTQQSSATHTDAHECNSGWSPEAYDSLRSYHI